MGWYSPLGYGIFIFTSHSLASQPQACKNVDLLQPAECSQTGRQAKQPSSQMAQKISSVEERDISLGTQNQGRYYYINCQKKRGIKQEKCLSSLELMKGQEKSTADQTSIDTILGQTPEMG